MLDSLRKMMGRGRKAADVAPVNPRPPSASNAQAADNLRREGNAHLSAGRLAEAQDCYARAVELSPQDAALHLNLGYALLAQGLHDEALPSLARSSELDAQSADAAYLTGRAHFEKGRYAQALEALERAVMLAPSLVAAKVDLANALAELGRFAEASQCAREATAQAPQDADAQAALARALREMGRHVDALAACEAALRVDANHVAALAGRATVLVDLRRFDEAVGAAEAAAAALEFAPQPHRAAIARTRSIALGGVHRHEDALVAALRAVELDAANPDNWCGLASTLQDLGRFEEALGVYRQAKEQHPVDAQIRWDESLCRLLLGDFEAGWKGHESRLHSPAYSEVDARVKSAAPRWDGSPLGGRRLLLHAEQGLGDAIQFARYAPLLAERENVVLQVQPALAGLMRQLVGKGRSADSAPAIALLGEEPPPHDLRCSLLSLPAIFCAGEGVPAGTYLRCNDESVRLAREKLTAGVGENRRTPNVGLVWSGNPRHHNDHNRSMPLSLLLSAMPPSVQPVALQPDMNAVDRETLEDSGIAWIGAELHDFVDTAAIVQSLDLVVTVDTSAAHLTGALGRPVWLLLPHRPDWRWQLGRDDTPWYPSMRLFRQERAGDWQPVIETVRSQLLAWAKARKAG